MTAVQTSPARATRRAELLLGLVVTVQLMIVLDNTVVNLALPSIRTDLGFSATGLAWVSNAYILVFGALLLLGGRLGDALGRRPVFLGSLALFTVASFVGGAAPTAGVLVAARAAQGLGAAALAPSALAILVATFEEGPARNRALALFFAMSAAGGAIGLVVGGGLVEALSWRWVLWINVPFGLVVLSLAPRAIGKADPHPRRLDVPGTITSTLGLGALAYGLTHSGGDGWIKASTILALTAAVLLLALFVALERRTGEPLLPLRLFATRSTGLGYPAMLLVPAVMVGMYFFTAQLVQGVLGLSPFETGLAFLPMSLLLFAGSRVSPQLLARFGPRPLLIAGSLAQVTGMVWLATADIDTTYVGGILGPMMLFGVAGSLLYAPLGSVLLSGVRPEDSGAASGAMQAVQQIGAALGIAALTSVFGTASGHRAQLDAASFADAVGTAYAAGAVIAVITLTLLAAAVPRHRSTAG